MAEDVFSFSTDVTSNRYIHTTYCDRHHPEGVANRVLCCCVPPACQGGETRGKTSG